MKRIGLALSIVLFTTPAFADPCNIYLKTKSTIQTNRCWEEGNKLNFELSSGSVMTIDKEDAERIEYLKEEVNKKAIQVVEPVKQDVAVKTEKPSPIQTDYNRLCVGDLKNINDISIYAVDSNIEELDSLRSLISGSFISLDNKYTLLKGIKACRGMYETQKSKREFDKFMKDKYGR